MCVYISVIYFHIRVEMHIHEVTNQEFRGHRGGVPPSLVGPTGAKKGGSREKVVEPSW